MNATTKIRNVELGCGMPKICVPVTSVLRENILEEVSEICKKARETVDIIELRIDFYEDVFKTDKVISLLDDIRKIIGEIPLLFTFRTKEEGGEKHIDIKDYESLMIEVAKCGFVDAIDLQVKIDKDVFEKVCNIAHDEGVKVVASNHDFNKTPKMEKMTEVLLEMAEKNADVAKIAVMPKDEKDVLNLLMASVVADEKINIPVVTISMGKLGAASRVCGGTFKSAMTFGTYKNSSAPGQMNSVELKNALEMLYGEENIMLIGFMGAGKTTVSNMLKGMTGRREIDVDAYIVEKEGVSINEIFEKHGEEYFRDIETKYLREICKGKNLLVSCGGGAVLRDENVEIMKKNGKIVLLTATPETTYERVKDSTDRPILNGNMNVEYITKLMERRKDRYLSVADITVATDDKEVKQICDEIIRNCKAKI